MLWWSDLELFSTTSDSEIQIMFVLCSSFFVLDHHQKNVILFRFDSKLVYCLLYLYFRTVQYLLSKEPLFLANAFANAFKILYLSFHSIN